jgi:large subunit ribosomal protein L4
MPSVSLRTTTGGDSGSIDLDDAVFGIEPNGPVMHQVVTAQLAARRSGTHSTLTRAEVRGGGAKPWRQKGTGRARAGSTRSPNWRGGGVAMGPRPRNYAQKTPKKMVKLALRSALSDRAAEGRVLVVDRWGWDTPRTKDAVAALQALGVDGRALVVLGVGDDVAWKSFRNLPQVHVIEVGQLNAYDVLVSDCVIFTSDTLPTGGDEGTKRRSSSRRSAAPEQAGGAGDAASEQGEASEASEGSSAGTARALHLVAPLDEEDDMANSDLPNRPKPAPGAVTPRVADTDRVKAVTDKPNPRFEAAKAKADREEQLRAKHAADTADSEDTEADDSADDDTTPGGSGFTFNRTGTES